MSVPRVAIVLLGLTVIGLATVQLRARRAQQVHEMQRLRAEQVDLQHALWALQLDKARLTAPAAIRERADRLNLKVVPPHDPQGPESPARKRQQR